MFSYVSLESRVPEDHPLRQIRRITDEVFKELSPEFEKLYPRFGRPSIAPEKLLRTLLLQVFYSIPSERRLMEELDYSMLFRWFVGLNLDDTVWDATVFSKNRQRLLDGEIARAFLSAVVNQSKARGLTSREHFTVDGTMLEAWASIKSYHKKEEPPQKGSGTRGRMLRRDMYKCATEPEAHLYRKSRGGEFKLSYLGHVLTENRSGLPVAARVTLAHPQGEWDAAVEMAAEVNGGGKRITLGADKGYDEVQVLSRLRPLNITPHFAKNENHRRGSNLDERTTRHAGYAQSLKVRRRIEGIFGWLKATAGLRRMRHRGRRLVEWIFTLAISGYHVIRLSRLIAQQA